MASGRLAVFVLYALSFVVSSIALTSISNVLPAPYLISYFVFGLSGVLIAFWVYEDGKTIEQLGLTEKIEMQRLSEKVNRANSAENVLERTKQYTTEPLDSESIIMANNLVIRYRSKGYLNPELLLESFLAEKIASGKTRKQALEELKNQE